MDLSFNIGTSCFNLRACAVIVHGEALLVMRDQKQPYAYLPGGRIKLNETAQQALIRELQEKGISMMDAPVGRTSVNAIDGTLLILAGGTDEQIARARPILMCMGNELVEAGGPGMGIRVKLINNYMSIALNALSSEAAVLCESLGLNLDVAIKVMSGTAAGKGHFTTTWPCKVLKGDLSPTFMVDLALKDLRIAVDVARETGAPLNMGIAAESYYAAASQDGKGRQDWSALLNQVRQQAGL